MMMSHTTTQSSHGATNNNPYLDKTQCRTCLAAMDRNQHYLFEQVSIGDEMVQTASIIMACASVQILVNDFYPQYICRTCLNEAVNSYAFRTKCELSQHRLLEASHVGTLKVETTTHLPTLSNQQQFKVEALDAYEVDVNASKKGRGAMDSDSDDDDEYVAGDAFGGDISSDDEVLANKIGKKEKRSSPRVSTTTQRTYANRKRKSVTPPRPIPNTPSTQHTCRQCDASFPTRAAFSKHRDTHASFSCRWCSGTKVAFASYETLLSHMRKKHKDEYQKQSELFDTKEEEEDEEELDDEPPVVAKKRKVTPKAKKVGRKGGKKKAASDAKVKVESLDGDDDDGENEAPSLDTDSNDPNCSTTSTPHQCHYCYKYYISESTLTTHITFCPANTTGTSAPPTVDITKISGVFTCSVCSRHFRTFRARTEHQRVHKGGVFCPYCGLHMPYRSMVNHRKREHGDDKDMVCDLCSGVYTGADDLESHMITHKSFRCSECTFTTKYVDEYRSHMLSYEIKKIAESDSSKCRECGDQQQDASALIEHYKTHEMVTCQECETNYNNVAYLIQHMSKAHSDIDTTVPEGDRKCTVCAKQFLTVEGMWQHRAKHNAETGPDGETTGELFCAYCNFRPKNNVSLGKHMQEEHHSQKTETCTVCDKSFFSAGKLKVHMLTHNADKQHVCEVCGAGFALKGNLNVHMRVHTGEKPYKCEICALDCITKVAFCKHQLVDHPDPLQELYRCHICKYAYARKTALEAHLQMIHSLPKKSSNKVVQKDSVQKSAKPEYHCSICKMQFESLFDLIHHVREFHQRKRSKKLPPTITKPAPKSEDVQLCSICGKKFGSRNYCELHMLRAHTTQRPFKCDKCHKGFVTATFLREHQRTHEKIRNHLCSICGKKYTSNSSLVNHRRIHLGTRNFLCQICNKSFGRIDNYRKHMKIHSGEKPYECLVCDFRFLYKHVLRSHIMNHDKVSKERISK